MENRGLGVNRILFLFRLRGAIFPRKLGMSARWQR